MQAPEQRWAYEAGRDSIGSDIAVDDESKQRAADRDHKLLCMRCRNEITTAADRIVVNERHDHTFANPAGYGYHIGCFGDAPGARPRGIPSGHWTWFAGYMWQLAICTRCEHHLGWLFRAREHTPFYSLILNRLIEEDLSG